MCDWPRCRSEEIEVIYFDKELCDRHWRALADSEPNSDDERNALAAIGYHRTSDGVVPLSSAARREATPRIAGGDDLEPKPVGGGYCPASGEPIGDSAEGNGPSIHGPTPDVFLDNG